MVGDAKMRLHLITVAVKGDWPFLRKSCHLYPGFTSKRLCHLCSCSDEWYDLSRHGAVRRLRQDDPIDDPFWPGDRPFLGLSTIGLDPRRIKPDPAHTYAINGWGTSLGASSLILLLRLGVFNGSTIATCLDAAFEMFRDHCRAFGKTTSLTEFSLKLLKIDSLSQFPTGSGKGHDCSIMLGWLENFCVDIDMRTIAAENHEIFKLLRWTLVAVGGYYRVLYQGGVFLRRSEALKALECGWKMLEGYHHLAKMAAQRQWCLFRLRPKLHLQAHLVLELQWPIEKGIQWIFNTMSWSCWSDEDFVGRVSRCSRRCHQFLVVPRTIARSLAQYKRQWRHFLE